MSKLVVLLLPLSGRGKMKLAEFTPGSARMRDMS
jgi:hypothetical protein